MTAGREEDLHGRGLWVEFGPGEVGLHSAKEPCCCLPKAAHHSVLISYVCEPRGGLTAGSVGRLSAIWGGFQHGHCCGS